MYNLLGLVISLNMVLFKFIHAVAQKNLCTLAELSVRFDWRMQFRRPWLEAFTVVQPGTI